MTAKPKLDPKLKIQNPRYAGATPEMVGRALLKPPKSVKLKPQKPTDSKPDVGSRI